MGWCLTSRSMTLLILSLLLQLPVAPAPAPEQDVDPALRAVVERFFATQQEESIEDYLALWSPRLPLTQRPRAEQLKYIFDSGQDEFSDLQLTHVWIDGDRARVRGRVTRARTDARVKRPDGSSRVFTSSLAFALGLAREDGEWKIVREGSPVDELAGALIDEPDAERRAALLAADPGLVSARLVDAIARRADALAQQQIYERAQQIYERSVEVARHLKDRKSLGQAVQNLANSFYFQRKFDLAKDWASRAYNLNPRIEESARLAL